MENLLIQLLFDLIILITSVFITWNISNIFHRKKDKQFKIWQENREEQLEGLRRHTGQSYSSFKEYFQHLTDKKDICLQDIEFYKSRKDINLDTLVATLRNNQKLMDSIPSFWITRKESSQYADFFRIMLWFIIDLQKHKFNDDNDLIRIKENFNKIKENDEEFGKYSHTITAELGFSLHDCKKMRGMKYYKSSI